MRSKILGGGEEKVCKEAESAHAIFENTLKVNSRKELFIIDQKPESE